MLMGVLGVKVVNESLAFDESHFILSVYFVLVIFANLATIKIYNFSLSNFPLPSGLIKNK